MNPLDILAWLERYGRQVRFQVLRPAVRRKNRVLLSYEGPDGQPEACGGRTLAEAVRTAKLRNSAQKRAVGEELIAG